MTYFPMINFTQLPAGDLCDYIVSKHHSYARLSLAVIQEQFSKLRQESEKNTEELTRVYSKFVALKEILDKHFKKEETVLFPFIKKMDFIKKGEAQGCFPLGVKVDNPLKITSREHENILGYFNEIRVITRNYSAPALDSMHLKICFSELLELEQDLFKHFFLEEHVLHPKLIELGNFIQQLETESHSK